ncbi:MAG: hypothetical protein KKE39_14465 [Bacteroidetes bacterium]|nr:hypothetical protein [Bacteroidota bacterium]MBU1374147.1 hypothetical protein [Bacteroidota bacterium]MBU1484740.1 hypothetical protein [Bacteroidota bacterium]MBU1760143.1 hypothetical protein [Bacteroidota bacterium]MBU2267668.1 hypothetical protein [Bacteroidota bacterium]
MKIALIEICEANHYTAVEALALTYAVSKSNQITVFITDEMAKLYHFKEDNIQIIKKNKDQSVADFLASINQINFDRIHINTISTYFKEFAFIDWKSKVILTVHNLDTWFNNGFSRRRKLLSFKLLNPSKNSSLKDNFYLPIKYFFKDFKLQDYRDQIIHKIKNSESQILVYSESQKTYLTQFIDKKKIIAFPFCIHQESEDLSINHQKLRICIPGMVDTHRRDYDSLFFVLTDHIDDFKGKLTIDLLGFIPDSGKHLISKIKQLNEAGIEVIFNEEFISKDVFQKRLFSSDIILGNLKVNLNSQSKYGETKETGVIFNLIKAAKPGIFPADYPIPKDLSSICISYQDDLYPVIFDLIQDKKKLDKLKESAKIVVQNYEPQNLYARLVN